MAFTMRVSPYTCNVQTPRLPIVLSVPVDFFVFSSSSIIVSSEFEVSSSVAVSSEISVFSKIAVSSVVNAVSTQRREEVAADLKHKSN